MMSGAATLIIRHGRQVSRYATAKEDGNMSQGCDFAKNQVDSDGGHHRKKKISWIPEFRLNLKDSESPQTNVIVTMPRDLLEIRPPHHVRNKPLIFSSKVTLQ
jgi:hypothetical protein